MLFSNVWLLTTVLPLSYFRWIVTGLSKTNVIGIETREEDILELGSGRYLKDKQS